MEGWLGFLEMVEFELGFEGYGGFDRVTGGRGTFWITLHAFSDTSFHQHKIQSMSFLRAMLFEIGKKEFQLIL